MPDDEGGDDASGRRQAPPGKAIAVTIVNILFDMAPRFLYLVPACAVSSTCASVPEDRRPLPGGGSCLSAFVSLPPGRTRAACLRTFSAGRACGFSAWSRRARRRLG